MAAVAINGGRVYLDGELVEANLLISDGVISSITRERVKGDVSLNAEGLVVLPGAIDVHAHINDPGYLYREDFESASRAALIGGVTTFVEMPLVKDIDDEASLKERVEAGLSSSLIDFSVHGGFMREKNADRVGELYRLGVTTFKVFTCRPFTASPATILNLLDRSRELGAIMLFHAEDEATLAHLEEKYRGRRDQLCVHEFRPPEAEALAVDMVATYAKVTRGHAHIVHLSSRAGLMAVARAKREGVDISSETCPQYLVFTRKDVERLGPYLKMAPSIKNEEDRDAMWRGLREGIVEMVATDHAPGTKREKDVGYEDPWKAWGGIPGLATMFPVLFTNGYLKGMIGLRTLVNVTSTNAAKRFGMKDRGRIAVGARGDLILIDPEHEVTFDGSRIYKVGWSPYDGMKLKGFPKHVISGGEVAVEDYEVVKRSRGSYVKLRPF